jgi:hypothetical protein
MYKMFGGFRSQSKQGLNLRSTMVRASLVAFLGLLFTAGAFAQYRTSIQGVVTDPDGAVIPGATLTLKDLANNSTVTRTSGDDGVYNFNALPADKFTLTVEKAGFKKQVLNNLELIPEQPNSVTVKLQLGAVDQSVTVDASTTPAVDTQTSNIGATISSNDIQHLPSFNRDVFTLTQLAPGVIADGSQGAGGGVYNTPGNQGPGGSGAGGAAPTENGPQANANGGQYGSNGISIDGISTVSAVWGGTTIITPTEDSIDNVRIVTNDYDAENGRFSGAQTLVTSKSGTNQLHGSLFFAAHRPGLNAFQRSTGTGTPQRDEQRFNQYGGSLGAPIWKDKVFAFFAYESTPNKSQATSTGWYETAAFRAAANANSIAAKYLNFPGSAPTGTVITNNETCATVGLTEGTNCKTIAGQGLDIGSPLTTGLGKQDLSSGATANNPGVGSGLDNIADVAYYLTSTPSSSYYRQYNGRLDANVSSKDHLAFAIYWVPQGATFYNGGARAYNLFNHAQVNQAMSVIYNHTFSPNFLNEARANVAGWRWNEITSNPQSPVGLPQDNITFFGPSNGANINQFGPNVGSIITQWTYGYKDVATKIAGKHTVKFGGDFTKLYYLSNPIGRPSYNFYNIWDFLNDAPSVENGGFSPITGLPATSRSDDRENLFGAFIQDDWKVLPNLTLHAGLRYSYFGSLYNKQNNIPIAHFGAGSATYTGLNVTTGGNLWNPQKGNVGPQFGFNWSPTMFHSNLTVRGGYGLNFNQEEIAITSSTFNNPPSTNYVNFAFTSPSNPGTNGKNIVYGISSSPTALTGYASNPNAITGYNTANLPTAGNANVTIIGDGHGNLPTSYTEHYSLDTEYQMGHYLVASLGYEGSVGRHLINHQTPNAPAVVAGYALNPLVTGGDYWTNVGSSNNNAFLAELKHPFSDHFTADAQFMWAKSMDTDGSGPYSEDPYFPASAAYSYGRSDFNVGKSLKVFGLWQPVIFKGERGWVEKIAGGWSLSGILNLHTGFPWTPNFGTSQSLYCSQCGYYNLRPQYLGGGGTDHSNKAFTQATNYAGIKTGEQQSTQTVNGTANTVVAYSNKFFRVPNFANQLQATNGTGFPAGNIALPGPPGIARNSFTGPNYRDVDASLTKAFGLPNNRVTGENAKLEVRADMFNVFNLLNLNPQSITNDITSQSFGQDYQALGARTISFQARFSF